MRQRITSSALAVLAVYLAMGIAVTTTAMRAAHAAENCLTQPNLKTAHGGHWYYRLDRVSGRKCWFVGQVNIKARHAGPLKMLPAPKPSPQPSGNSLAKLMPSEENQENTPLAPVDDQSVTPFANSDDTKFLETSFPGEEPLVWGPTPDVPQHASTWQLAEVFGGAGILWIVVSIGIALSPLGRRFGPVAGSGSY